jgi:hypothetical protein
MRTSSRCHGSSFGECFSTKYRMFSCGSAGNVSLALFGFVTRFSGSVRQRSLNCRSRCASRSARRAVSALSVGAEGRR